MPAFRIRLFDDVRLLLIFTWRQALSCLFPFSVVLILGASHILTPSFIHRYDFILLACMGVQALMLASKLETLDELKVICAFHLLGLLMELYKTRMGSWSYPEPAWTKFGGVPLYSGFMYASVASYICQAWKRFHLHITGFPLPWLALTVAALTYLNFFTLHYLHDVRWWLAGLIAIVFMRTWVFYRVGDQPMKMPLVLAFLLIGFFVWVAENIATRFGAWQYPHQAEGWQPVHLQKISSWALMVIISVIVVAQLKARTEERHD